MAVLDMALLLNLSWSRLPIQLITQSSSKPNDLLEDTIIDPEEHMREMLTWADEIDYRAKKHQEGATDTKAV